MKKIKFIGKLLFSLCLVAFLVSCSNDNDEPNEQQINYDEISKSTEIDGDLETLDEMTLKILETQEASESSKMPPNFNMPPCLSITVEIQQNYREVTLDFGTEGCEINGKVFKGVILMTYTRNPQEHEMLITKSFVDFYINAKNIQGSKTVLRERFNNNNNMQFTKTVNLTIVWPNGETASRSGVKVKEWIEGQGSGVWSDNVFEITGNWTTTFINGNSHSYAVLTPLRREMVCAFFVSGSVDVVRTNFTGVLDYGDGNCDNMATFTLADETVIEITLN